MEVKLMSTMYKARLNMGGKMKTIVVVNYKNEGELVENKSVDCLHHIHILDRSGSMSGNIYELIENVKKTIEYIPDNDYVSIVWFSGAGEYKTLIKGARKDTNLYKLLDSIKSTLGCTCFSDPLKEVGEIINDLKAICSNFNVTLFTDGYPVTPWSEEEEERKIFKNIDVWKDEAIALNTVGYGNYYNEKLLRDIAAKTQFGLMIHSSKINEYMGIFSHNYERVSELVMDSVLVESTNTEIIYLNEKTSKMTNETLKMSMLDKRKNQFILVCDREEFIFKINDEIFDTEDIKDSIQPNTLIPVQYVYAYQNYYNGDNRQYCLDILAKTIKDKYLVDEQFKAFTFDECGEFIKKMKKTVFSSKGRMLHGECPNGYLPKDDAICAMDVLKLLIEGNNSYIYSSEYNRIGVQTVDNFDLFKWNPGPQITSINELVFNKEKLNVSIRSTIKGTVDLNPKQAAKVGLDAKINSRTYRNQTLVKDGNLNMDSIKVIVDEDTFTKLNNLGIEGLVDEVGATETNGTQITLNLTTIPVINRTYLSDAGKIENVLKNTYEITVLEAQQKVANYFNKMCKKYTKYTPEQVELLKEHGLSESLEYIGVDNKKTEKVEEDYYEARELTFDIKGYASLPSVKDVQKKIKENGKLNGPATLMKEYMDEIQKKIPVSLLDETISFDGDSEFFENEVKRIKNIILSKRVEMASMKIAKVLTGDWFKGLIPDEKGNYNYTDNGRVLVAKTEKVKVFFN
jgi:hypothetical protein